MKKSAEATSREIATCKVCRPALNRSSTAQTMQTIEDETSQDIESGTNNTITPPSSCSSPQQQKSTDTLVCCSRSFLECAVCLEGIQVDEVASWSADDGCGHVFHHACIKEWLLRRSECPLCRCTLLPVDAICEEKDSTDDSFPSENANFTTTAAKFRFRKEDPFSPARLETVMLQWRNRMASTYCCIQDGLVQVPVARGGKNKAKLYVSSGFRELVRPCIQRSELTLLRGSRNEGDDVLTI